VRFRLSRAAKNNAAISKTCSAKSYAALTTALIYLLLAGYQLLGPVPIGLADNGDFPKILGALAIGHAPGTENATANRYFVTHYAISRQLYWWLAHIPSSEYWMAKAAKRLALWFSPHGHFDIRYMGAVHLAVMAMALWLLIRAFRKRPLWQTRVLSILLLFICTDIEYVQFFSTAYADAAAIVFFCCFVGVALNICLNPELANLPWMLAFTLFGCLFLSAKLQHQLGIFPLCTLALWFGWRARRRMKPIVWMVPVFAFVATTVGMVKSTRQDYRADPIYAMIFCRLAPMSHDPDQVLKDFGLPDRYRQYVGKLPFKDGYLLNNLAERDYFVKHITLGKVAAYYLAHPGMCYRALASDLKIFAPDVNLANWDAKHFRVDQYAAHRDDIRFKWWSSLRRVIAAKWWLLNPLFYAAVFLLAIAAAFRQRWATRLPGWPILLLLCFEGASTFAVASLNDYVETARHIILFQVCTDLLVVLLMMEAMGAISTGLRRNATVSQMDADRAGIPA
jgi:hypothetical protein